MASGMAINLIEPHNLVVAQKEHGVSVMHTCQLGVTYYSTWPPETGETTCTKPASPVQVSESATRHSPIGGSQACVRALTSSQASLVALLIHSSLIDPQ
jgi:hypothetical protein